MELQNAIEKRKSIRKAYDSRPVEREKLIKMLDAAALAPSWKNSQPARYYVVTGENTLKSVKSALPEFNQKNVENAPVLIVTSVVLNHSGFDKDGVPANELGNGWSYYDCGLSNMNLLLKASDLGLSTLVIGIRDAKKLAEILNIPEAESVVSVISVGYSSADPERPKRKPRSETAFFFED